MFDIGWSELVVIGVVALIAIGPKELPGVLRSVGFWMGKVRKMAAEFQGLGDDLRQCFGHRLPVRAYGLIEVGDGRVGRPVGKEGFEFIEPALNEIGRFDCR